ncbi:MAG: DUF4823 domain-containing protein [Pseudomonadales bacterium]|nr:DUF4823 domain-containing protein [Pseudomonadales bacterium]
MSHNGCVFFHEVIRVLLIHIARLAVIMLFSAGLFGCFYSDAHSSHPSLRTLNVPLLSDGYEIKRRRNFVIPIDSRIYIPIPIITIPLSEITVTGSHLRKASSQSKKTTGVSKVTLKKAVMKKKKERAQALMAVQTRAFGSQFANVRSGKKPIPLDVALKFAKKEQMNFLLYAQVSQWDDQTFLQKKNCHGDTVSVETPRQISSNHTMTTCDWALSSPLDKASLSIWMYEVRSQQLVDVISVMSRSGAMTFIGDTPVSLLEKPLSRLAKTYSEQ